MLKANLIHWLVALVCLIGAWEQVNAEQFDFGTVVQGEVVSHVFHYRNNEDYPVVVYQVGSSCGCVAADIRALTLEPGEQVDVPVTFHTDGVAGSVKREVQVLTSHLEKPVVSWWLSGTVNAPIRILSSALDFGRVLRGGTSKEHKVTVEVSNASTSLRVRALHPAVTIREYVSKGREREFGVRLQEPSRLGTLHSLLSFSVRGSKDVAGVLPLSAEVYGGLELDQEVLAFGAVRGPDPVERFVTIHLGDQGSPQDMVERLSVETEHSALEATVLVGKEKDVVLRVRLHPRLMSKKRLRSSVRLELESEPRLRTSLRVIATKVMSEADTP